MTLTSRAIMKWKKIRDRNVPRRRRKDLIKSKMDQEKRIKENHSDSLVKVYGTFFDATKAGGPLSSSQ